MVEAHSKQGARITQETCYYLLNQAMSAQAFGQAVRSHWRIENQMHWVLDIAFREDESRVRIGQAPQNLAVLRHMALHLLKQERTANVGIKAKRLKAGWSEEYLGNVLAA